MKLKNLAIHALLLITGTLGLSLHCALTNTPPEGAITHDEARARLQQAVFDGLVICQARNGPMDPLYFLLALNSAPGSFMNSGRFYLKTDIDHCEREVRFLIAFQPATPGRPPCLPPYFSLFCQAQPLGPLTSEPNGM